MRLALALIIAGLMLGEAAFRLANDGAFIVQLAIAAALVVTGVVGVVDSLKHKAR